MMSALCTAGPGTSRRPVLLRDEREWTLRQAAVVARLVRTLEVAATDGSPRQTPSMGRFGRTGLLARMRLAARAYADGLAESTGPGAGDFAAAANEA